MSNNILAALRNFSFKGLLRSISVVIKVSNFLLNDIDFFSCNLFKAISKSGKHCSVIRLAINDST